MTARSGPGDDDRRLRDGERRIGERLAGQLQSNDRTDNLPARRAQPVNVWAHGYLVVGTRGLCRLVLVVASCPFCRRPHAHNGKPSVAAGKRKASCGRGRYTVHVGAVEGEVAA